MTPKIGTLNQSTRCKICGEPSEFFDRAEILRKYDAAYFRCSACGFVQTETPYWLEEAYSSAIGRLDTGIISRNLLTCRYTSSVLNLLYPRAKRSLDFGAGHGILVRLMRDRGFDFYWYDLHASNDYAGGFEHKDDNTYDFLTSFEVLEHLVDPITELDTMMNCAPNVFLSTQLLPNPAPKISDWWYYCPTGGQHISFYSRESLLRIASRYGRTLLTNGSNHLFTTEPKSKVVYYLATSRWTSSLLNALYKRPSLIESDFQLMRDEGLNHGPSKERILSCNRSAII